MRLLSPGERRDAGILFRSRLLSGGGLGDKSNTLMLFSLTPLMGSMVALVEVGEDAVSLMPFMPGLYLGLTALVAVAAVVWHAAPDVSHPGDSILATLPRVGPSSRYAEASASFALWMIAVTGLFAIGPFAVLQAMGHADSAQAILSIASTGPLLALFRAFSERLRSAVLPHHTAWRWAGWAMLSALAAGPALAAGLGAGPNEAALWGGPLWIAFQVLSVGAQGGLGQFAAVYAFLVAAALAQALVPPRFSDDALEKGFGYATPQQTTEVERLIEQYRSLRDEALEGDVPAMEFGTGARSVFKALEPPPERAERARHKQVRDMANGTSALLAVGIVVLWVLVNGPALQSVGWLNLSLGAYFMVLAPVAAFRFPGRGLDAKIAGASEQLQRAAGMQKKARPTTDASDLRGWETFATFPVERALLEELFMKGYREGLLKAPLVAGGSILFLWMLTGSLLGSAQLVLGFGVTMAALILAIQVAMAPCHRKRKALRYAYYSGIAAWATGGFALCMPALWGLRTGVEVGLNGAEAAYAAACGLLLVAHLLLYGAHLRESLIASGRPYADWARVALAWGMAAALFGVTGYIALARLSS